MPSFGFILMFVTNTKIIFIVTLLCYYCFQLLLFFVLRAILIIYTLIVIITSILFFSLCINIEWMAISFNIHFLQNALTFSVASLAQA